MLWLITELLLTPLGLVSIVLIVLYYYVTHTYGFWKTRGIPYIKPKYPFLGNLYDTMFSLKCNHIKQHEIYNYFSGERFGGVFTLTTPTLFIRDPTLIESVLIKDFTSFYNRGTTVDVKTEPVAMGLTNLEDMQWKSLRQKLTSAFSSGKLKGMYQQIVECSDELVKHVDDHLQKSEPIEIRDAMANLTIDVIGSCAFGLSVNTLKNPDCEFKKIGKKRLEASTWNKLGIVIRIQHSSLQRIMSLFQKFSARTNFVNNVTQNIIAYREKNNIVRNDFVQMLLELKKQDMEKQKAGNLENDQEIIVDDNVVAANAAVFFFGGFDTTAATLSYCMYELSLNQDIQEEAYRQIVDVLNKHGGEITYDAVKEMKLIHQIFCETLRLHPPAVELRRKTSKNYTIPGTSLTLPKGVPVIIPVYSLQHDPEYFPEPEKFKPERFNNKKENIKKGTYMPFGYGPRICIAKRFAEMDMHVVLVKLLLNYKCTLNPKTISPLVYNPKSFVLAPIGGIWLDIHKRV